MKLIKSLVVFIAVIALGVAVYFFVFKSEEMRKENETKQKYLIRFNFDSVKSLTLARPESTIVFQRGIGRIWNITQPIKCEASNEELQNLFNDLNKSEILYIVEEKPKDLQMFDLKNSKYYMVISLENGKQDTLFIGKDTPDGTMSYIKFSSEKRVLAIDKKITNKMKWPIRTYRSRTVINIEDTDVTSLDIIRSENDRVNMVYDGSIWIMNEPWNFIGDQSNIKNLIKLIAETNKSSLVTEKSTDLSKYGLDNPSLVFSVTLKFGMPDKMVLVGNKLTELGSKHLWYAKQFDNDVIFTLDDNVVKDLTRKTEWYIDKNPMKFEKEFINKIVLETGNNSVVFVKDAQRNWSVVSPVDKNIDISFINKLFGCTYHIIINGVLSVKPTENDLTKSGLKKPKIIISVFQDDKLLDKIEFGKTLTYEEPTTYFRIQKTPTVFVTKNSVASDINKVLDEVFKK